MIKLQGITKEYHIGETDIFALNNVNLNINRGEFITIMGPSGSGKSTLLNILGVLDLPTTGSYLLEEVDITALNDSELAGIRNQHFGFIFQSYNLFPELTALENVTVPLTYARRKKQERLERANELLGMVGMSHRVNHFPNQLSGGEQQRVAIARALANNPTLLLADEPTGNLATDQGDEIMGLLDKLNQEGTTVVIVTHDIHVSSFSKRLVQIQDGQIVSDKLLNNSSREENVL